MTRRIEPIRRALGDPRLLTPGGMKADLSFLLGEYDRLTTELEQRNELLRDAIAWIDREVKYSECELPDAEEILQRASDTGNQ